MKRKYKIAVEVDKIYTIDEDSEDENLAEIALESFAYRAYKAAKRDYETWQRTLRTHYVHSLRNK